MSASEAHSKNVYSAAAIASALGAQAIWGVFPLYLQLLLPTPSVEIVCHRAVWSLTTLIILVSFATLLKWTKVPKWKEILAVFKSPQLLCWVGLAAGLILLNWLGFVFAVTHERAMDASVGYYICPQIVVLLGVVFQRERLTKLQWCAFGVTTIGVLVMSASATGVPWFGLLVAFSFGFYALVKKRIKLPALSSLTVETAILAIPALVYFYFLSTGTMVAHEQGQTAIVSPWAVKLFLVLSGAVTITPLVLYVWAVQRLPLSVVGPLQFLGPTLQFLVSLFVLGEPFDWIRMTGFVCVWVGVIFYLRSMKPEKNRQA